MTPPQTPLLYDRLSGCLLGTALGDALGLPAEGMSAGAIARRFGRIERFRLLGTTGFVSDDTEQAALVAQSIIRRPEDPAACAREFRRSLLGWFLRLPWGIGLATIKSCIRIALGFRRSGVPSAGNGAAMRASIIGVFFREDAAKREAFVKSISQVTHTHPLAVDGANFVANIAAECANSDSVSRRDDVVQRGIETIAEEKLRDAIRKAVSLAESDSGIPEASHALGTSGYVLHTIPFATFCFLRFGDNPLESLTSVISAGGDTDSIGAILGGWLGALHGEAALPKDLIRKLHDGPFGPSHLRSLADDLNRISRGENALGSGYSPIIALMRNLGLYPVILTHGFRRLLPL